MQRHTPAVIPPSTYRMCPFTKSDAGAANERMAQYVRSDVRLAPGNSGGPVVDAHGRLLGVSTMIVGGLGLAIPVADVDRFVVGAHGPSHLAHGWTRAA